MQVLSTRPHNGKLSVAAYFDGTATGIQSDVLKGHTAFQKAQKCGDLDQVILTGTRRSPKGERKLTAAYLGGVGIAAAAGVAAGLMGAPDLGVLLGISAVPALALGVRHLQAALTEPRFDPGVPSTQKEHVARLHKALQELRGEQKVAYLSGHGSHKTIAGISPENVRRALTGTGVELTVLDACTTAQLEVLAQLSPQAGLALCSTHTVPGKGFPIRKMFKNREHLAEEAFESARKSTSSLSLIDTGKLAHDLLPALDELGRKLTEAIDNGERGQIRKALARSKNPDLLGPRTDLRSFLKELEKQPWNEDLKTALDRSVTAMDETMVKDTGWSFSFRLDGAQDHALPVGWQAFIEKMDLWFKPMF